MFVYSVITSPLIHDAEWNEQLVWTIHFHLKGNIFQIYITLLIPTSHLIIIMAYYYKHRASCLVNPRACYETTLKILPVANTKKLKIAVVGGGPSGLACATTAAQRGHHVTLFEKDAQIGESDYNIIHFLKFINKCIQNGLQFNTLQ